MIAPQKYKPVGKDFEVIAVQVSVENIHDIANWIGLWTGRPGQKVITPRGIALLFSTLTGETRLAYCGWWVIQSPTSNYDLFTCEPSTFSSAFEKVGQAVESYDEDTLLKVYACLTESGLTEEQAIDAVTCMQNKGVLFREIKQVS